KIAASPIRALMAAISAGILEGNTIVDLDYEEDKMVTVDFNLVGTEDGALAEVQASGEEAMFSRDELGEMLQLGQSAIAQLVNQQRRLLPAPANVAQNRA